MSLVTYDDARPWARAMREEVLARRMPKWHAARGFGQFANDPSLSPFEIALIVAWVDGGAIRGPDPTTVAAPLSPFRPPAARIVTQPCTKRTLPSGRLLGITPQLSDGASTEFMVQLPNGDTRILAWIRSYEREFEQTYWLRTPIALSPGSRLVTDATRGCSVQLHLAVD
jgi:hypothetical protein